VTVEACSCFSTVASFRAGPLPDGCQTIRAMIVGGELCQDSGVRSRIVGARFGGHEGRTRAEAPQGSIR